MSSRLFLELRERLGLAYDVNSYVSNFLDTGAFSVYAGVDPRRRWRREGGAGGAGPPARRRLR